MADITVFKPAALTVAVVDGDPPTDQSALVASLQQQVAQLTAANQSLTGQVSQLTAANATLQQKITNAQAALA